MPRRDLRIVLEFSSRVVSEVESPAFWTWADPVLLNKRNMLQCIRSRDGGGGGSCKEFRNREKAPL